MKLPKGITLWNDQWAVAKPGTRVVVEVNECYPYNKKIKRLTTPSADFMLPVNVGQRAKLKNCVVVLEATSRLCSCDCGTPYWKII